MLHNVGFLAPLILQAFPALASCGHQSLSCPVETIIPNACRVDKQALDVASSFQEKISEKNTRLLKDPNFQEVVSALQQQIPNSLRQGASPFSAGQLYIFISFSCGEKALLNIAIDAKRWGANLVLRGFKDGSYTKTAQALRKIILKTGQGIMIDPELFTLFAITAVPTFILAKPLPPHAIERFQTPLHDRLQGHVNIGYALETFTKEGSLKDEARVLLKQGGSL